MQIRFEILKKGDEVLNVWENKIAIKKKNGDVEILHYDIGEDGLPRMAADSVLITQGNGILKKKDEISSVEFGTF